MKMPMVAVVALVALTACDAPGAAETTSAPTAPIVSTVSASDGLEANAIIDFVIDGDTVDVIINGSEERVRLIGIDTPETKKRNSPIECFGPEATVFTQQLLPVGTPVYIERDVVNRDDFGRLLGRRVDRGLRSLDRV
jgi:micrococcal nuclease